jgi:hypothetical protein
MLSLDTPLSLPAHVSFSVVGEDAFLLNTRNSKYYLLAGSRRAPVDSAQPGINLRAAHQTLLDEYEVAPEELERDLLELLTDLLENGLVEVAEA